MGTERIPAAGCFGSKQKNAADCRVDGIGAQIKKGYKFPGYLLEWLEGIRAVAFQNNEIGIVVWGDKGVRDNDSLVCLRFGDWLKVLDRMRAVSVVA